MKIRAILFSTFLSWVAFDQNLFRQRTSEVPHAAEALALGEDRIRKRRRVLRNHWEVIPPWHRTKKAKLRMKVNHFNSYSRDPRDSNQRKIRRKINNA